MNRKQLLAPCKGCKNREIDCHSNCEKYACYTKELKRIKEIQRDKKIGESWSY